MPQSNKHIHQNIDFKPRKYMTGILFWIWDHNKILKLGGIFFSGRVLNYDWNFPNPTVFLCKLRIRYISHKNNIESLLLFLVRVWVHESNACFAAPHLFNNIQNSWIFLLSDCTLVAVCTVLGVSCCPQKGTPVESLNSIGTYTIEYWQLKLKCHTHTVLFPFYCLIALLLW